MPANPNTAKRRPYILLVSGLAALMVLLMAALISQGTAGAAVGSAAGPLVTPTPCGGNYTWQHVPSPNVGSDHNILRGIGVVSTNDVWAVGYTDPSQDTLIQRWNGTQWTVVPSPNVGTYSNKLYGITVIGANDIWAVGSYYDENIFKTRPLTLHYDGSTWTIVPVNIDFGVDYVDLMGVTAASSNEVIAVGSRSYNTQSPLTLHWDGTQWREELSGRIPGCPGSPYTCSFYGVTAVGPNDAWAVGAIHDNGPATLTAHWNGTTWTRVASPNPSQSTNFLGAITNAGPDNVWAAGFYLDYSTGRFATLTMRWTGAAWVIVPSPNPSFNIGGKGSNPKRPLEQQVSPDGSGYYPPSSPAGNMLLGISAAAPDEIWAVGSSDQVGDSETNTLILRWNGSQWTVVPSANPSGFAGYNRLYAVDVAGRDDAWASGIYWVDAENRYASLTERYNGQNCPTPIPTAPVATPTPCSGNPVWAVIPSPNGPSVNNQLKTVGVVSANDIWALGSHYNGLIGGLIEHWDGNNWTIVPNSIRTSGFEDIAVISANDIWAVGNGGGNPDGAVTAHWDGTSWTRVGLSEFGPDDSLYGVEAVAPNNVWAVGYNDYGVLILHWNGTSWSRTGFDMGASRPDLNGPSVPSDYLTRLIDVDVVSSSDIWAVGTIRVSGSNRTLIMHYDGTSWNFVSSPNPGAYSNVLESVTVVAPNDIWAVGYYANSYSTLSQSLALHWNGTIWTQVATPSPGFSPDAPANSENDGTFLYGVTAVSASEVWAVGKYVAADNGIATSVTLRWNGTQWERIASPNPANINLLFGVAAIAPDYVWAVGAKGTNSNMSTLTMRFGPPCNATPVPTNTPRPPTNTPILPTITIGTVIPTITTNTPTPQSTSTAAPSFTAVSTPTCGPLWHRVTSPDPPNGNYNQLSGVAVVSPNDVWAVGEYRSNGSQRVYIERWNGSAWSLVPVPDTGYSGLSAISVVSASDIWAVGFANIGGFYQPMSLHWNGTVWTEIPTPRPFPGSHGYLRGVGAVSANDVWAVGDGPNGPLTMHWDGQQWTITPNPFTGNNKHTPGKDNAPGSYDNALFAVGVVSSNDVWAVGTRNGITWALRWNGTQWNQVSTPNPASVSSLNAITVIAPNNIWAVGHAGFYLDPQGAIALHWNGTTWTSMPPPAGNFGLFGVTATSPNDVWAVGIEDLGQYSTDTLILGWNGTAWTRVPSPNPSYSGRDELYGIDAAGPADIWAVGMFDFETLIDRYNGQPCGTPGPTNTAAPPTGTVPSGTNTAVPATSTTGTATAIPTVCPGTTITGALTLQDPTQVGRLNTLTQASTCAAPRSCPGVLENVPRHYDAYTFRNTSNSEACFTVDVTAACLNNILIQSAAYLGSFNPSDLCLNYLADVGPGVLTNSQYSFTVQAGQTFVVVVNELAPNLLCPNYTLSVSGPACPVAGTPVPTSTSILPTVTVPATIPATVTVPPIPTIGACNIVFSDVPSNNAFYQQIMCLSCMGFTGGYPDGTFRPNSEITRGQLSKIVSNTAGFSDTPTQQTFADVPEGSTFYMFIERMAQRGVISGYPCGGLGEPCAEGNKPYFRPYANATRGQISKVVANAANLTDTPTGQSFEDVPSSHPFYLWIQRLAQHGMMSGYACGGAGELCGTTNRPYFRPANNATRGQVSKIVANGFYPGCTTRSRP